MKNPLEELTQVRRIIIIKFIHKFFLQHDKDFVIKNRNYNVFDFMNIIDLYDLPLLNRWRKWRILHMISNRKYSIKKADKAVIDYIYKLLKKYE